MEPQMAPQVGDAFTVGTHDRNGAGDHDLPYRFGRRPTTETPFPFSTWELARLLGLRSRVQAGLFSGDRMAIRDEVVTDG